MLKYKNGKRIFRVFVYEISSLIVVIMVLYVYFWNVKGGTLWNNNKPQRTLLEHSVMGRTNRPNEATRIAYVGNLLWYTSFRPAQEAPIASLLRNEDVIGIMPTGAGKSICFQIPALL